MASKTERVNRYDLNNGTFSARLVAERERLGLTQIELRTRTGATKATQSRYETGESLPAADYLAALDAVGVDVMYLLTGERSAGALDDELQNLVDAYVHAGDATKAAVFGVLVAPYSEDARRARKEPGWFAHEVRGDEDVRYVRQVDVVPTPPPTLQDAPSALDLPGKLAQPEDDGPDVPPII